MKLFQLALLIVVGLVAGTIFYPSISLVGQKPSELLHPQASDSVLNPFNDLLSRQRRFLQVDNTTVVNATTLAVASFYFGSIVLGVLSVFNDAAISVAKHKRAHRKKLRAKHDKVTPITIQDGQSESAKYEQAIQEYKKKYQEYLDQYREWAKKYGQDPTPHDIPATIFKRYLPKFSK